MKSLLALVGLVAGTALGQSVPALELEQLHLDPAALGSLLVGNGQTLRGGDFRASAALQHTQGHLQTRAHQILLRDRTAVHLLGAIGLTDWLELGVDLPVVVYQVSGSGQFHPSRSGLGTPILQAKLAIVDDSGPVAVWAALGVGLPVGNGSALGNGGLLFTPRLNVGRRFERLQLGAELGGLIRQLAVIADTPLTLGELFLPGPRKGDPHGSQLSLALNVSQLRPGLRSELSMRVFLSLTGGPAGLETLFGLRYPLDGLELFVAIGPGIEGAPATPGFRFYAGAAFGPP